MSLHKTYILNGKYWQEVCQQVSPQEVETPTEAETPAEDCYEMVQERNVEMVD